MVKTIRHMSKRSYGCCWLHLVWATASRKPVFSPDAARSVATFLKDYSNQKGFRLRNVYVNPEHVHVLIGVDPVVSAAEVVKLLKGASSRWVNIHRLTLLPFAWGKGYGVFSVSRGDLNAVGSYISGQAEHHRRKSFREELAELLPEWLEETVETVPRDSSVP